MDNRPELTDRQRQVYDFIENTIEELGYPPTIREIGEHLGIRSTNGVADHLKALKRKGYLPQRGQKSRTLIPAQRPKDATVSVLVPKSNQTMSIPILGRVAAGEPILAEEHAEGTVQVDSFLVGGDGRKTFALKVVGESMIEDGIFDGDFIFVRKRSYAERGDVVVVMIENEATVKRYHPQGNRIRLQPANASMKPIYINKKDFRQAQILGVVVGVYRKMAQS